MEESQKLAENLMKQNNIDALILKAQDTRLIPDCAVE